MPLVSLSWRNAQADRKIFLPVFTANLYFSDKLNPHWKKVYFFFTQPASNTLHLEVYNSVNSTPFCNNTLETGQMKVCPDDDYQPSFSLASAWPEALQWILSPTSADCAWLGCLSRLFPACTIFSSSTVTCCSGQLHRSERTMRSIDHLLSWIKLILMHLFFFISVVKRVAFVVWCSSSVYWKLNKSNILFHKKFSWLKWTCSLFHARWAEGNPEVSCVLTFLWFK